MARCCALQDELLAVAGSRRRDEPRSGFVALAGRPNVGKSTLVNALVGEKVAIVSDRPQTTRRAIRGVAARGDCQLVLVDLPGVQRPRDALTERMAQRVQQELEGCRRGADDAQRRAGGRTRAIASSRRQLAAARAPVTIAVNKVDRLARAGTLEVLAAGRRAGDLARRCSRSRRAPASAWMRSSSISAAQMPRGAVHVRADASSDQPRELLLAELIREAVIRRTFQELPHAVEVRGRGDRIAARWASTRVRALIWVESESQKGILIGAGGRMIKAIGDGRAQGTASASSAARCTSTCRCACAATGAATKGCSTASASPEHAIVRPARSMAGETGCSVVEALRAASTAPRSATPPGRAADHTNGTARTSKLAAAQARELVVLEARAVVHGARRPVAAAHIRERAPRRAAAACGERLAASSARDRSSRREKRRGSEPLTTPRRAPADLRAAGPPGARAPR